MSIMSYCECDICGKEDENDLCPKCNRNICDDCLTESCSCCGSRLCKQCGTTHAATLPPSTSPP